MYISEGLRHGYCALTDSATVAYLCSAVYAPERERAVHPMDPDLDIDWPALGEPLLSERDAGAPTLRVSGLRAATVRLRLARPVRPAREAVSAVYPRIRRRVLRTLAVTVLAVPSLLAASGAAQADSAPAAKTYSPAGTGSAQVQTSIPSSGTTSFTFLADGTMGNDTDTWYCTGRKSFSYDSEHPHKDANGDVDGSVVGHQDAVMSDNDHWTSHGVSKVLDLEGNVMSSFTVDVVATRTS